MRDPNLANENSSQSEPNVSSQAELPETPTLIVPPEGLWDGNAPVGSITSPSETGKYRMVLRDYAATVQIEGSLVTLDYQELDHEGKPVKKTVLCQVSRTRSQNRHHENPILGSLLREKGRIPGLSGFADHKEVDLLPMDTLITDTGIHQLPRNIPPMGTDVRFASNEDVEAFSGHHRTVFNIGYLYETKVPIGLMLKHFGSGDDGWGDAHMLGVFGVSGSGKTVMAASIMAGFAARHEMGMLIVDPQGQFSGFELGSDPAKWSWALNEAFRLAGRGRDVTVVRIDDIALESTAIFIELLDRNKFFDNLGIRGHDNKKQTKGDLRLFLGQWLKQNKNRTLGDLAWSDDIFNMVCKIGAATYTDPAKKQKAMQNAFDTMPFKKQKAEYSWEQVRNKFDRSYQLGDLLDDVLVNQKIIILDVNTDESLKDLYCGEILDGIKKKAESIYRIKQGIYWRGKGKEVNKYKNVETNALIVIDEAHRFAPQSAGRGTDQERTLATLRDAIKTTRKLGVGWCYITQSIADFDKGVFRQIQTKVLGVGIGTGADEQHLEAAFNRDKDLIQRYRNLPRPITTGVFPYAIIGELVALGNGSRALFVSAPGTQQELFDLNPEHFKYPNGAPVSNQSASSTTEPTRQLPRTQRRLSPPPPRPAQEDNIPF